MVISRKRIDRHVFAYAAVTLCIFYMSASADFYPHRIYKVRTKASLNAGWKFFKGDDAGASSPAFNDAAWQTVNVPHSAQYDPPTINGELQSVPTSLTWNGVHWYRKSFTIPSTAHNQRIFLEFEGAMQIAEVWVNGTKVGTHDASGYSGFFFDISTAVNRTGSNVVAIRLDCRYRNNIPPGNEGNYNAVGVNTLYPDYFLFSGLYRDVWLVCTDDIHIPINGQKISTPVATSTGARVRVQTTVRNDSAVSKNVTVAFCIADKTDNILATCEMTASVAANASHVFDTTTSTLANPQLWSPETPDLYRVFTKVSVDSQVVDDYVDRFGIRSIDWTRQGFYCNGQRYLLKGVCMHQEFAWVENAVPNSRFFEEVKLVKNMGANAIRCSHFPRDPSFYNACDELGVICEPELPSWGNFHTTYPADFWDRMNIVAQEMIDVGYNHPSIILWGIFNEPAGDNTAEFRRLNSTVKALDSSRYSAIINNHVSQTQNLVVDVLGLNYNLYPGSAIIGQVQRTYNAEYHEGWIRWCYRGDTNTTNDATLQGPISENRWAVDRWSGTNNWTAILAAYNGTTQPVPAGGHMWCFIDYWSPFMDYPMGVLDHYRIPKKVYCTFRTNWTGVPDDYPVVGLTPAKIQLDADLTTLVADSTDITRIVASVRDASGRCAFSSRSVTLQISGPIDCFDSLTRTTIAGKIGWVLKSKNTPGTITVIGISSGLVPDTVIIASVAPDSSALPFIWPASGVVPRRMGSRAENGFTVRQSTRLITVAFSSPRADAAELSLVTMQGRKAAAMVSVHRSTVTIDTRTIPAGLYCLYIKGTFAKKIVLTK